MQLYRVAFFPIFEARKNSAQTFNAETNTIVNWETVITNTGNLVYTNNNTLTIAQAGFYSVNLQFQVFNTPNLRRFTFDVRRNGVGIGRLFDMQLTNNIAYNTLIVNAFIEELSFSAGNTLTINCFQSSLSNTAVSNYFDIAETHLNRLVVKQTR